MAHAFLVLFARELRARGYLKLVSLAQKFCKRILVWLVFKTNDTVIVLTGKDRGKKGAVIALSLKNDKVMVKVLLLLLDTLRHVSKVKLPQLKRKKHYSFV